MRLAQISILLCLALFFFSCSGNKEEAKTETKNNISNNSAANKGAQQQNPVDNRQSNAGQARQNAASQQKNEAGGIKESYSESKGKTVKHTMNAGRAFKMGQSFGEQYCKCLENSKKSDCAKRINSKMESIKKENDVEITKYLDKAYQAVSTNCK